jgi:hypothetical protein
MQNRQILDLAHRLRGGVARLLRCGDRCNSQVTICHGALLHPPAPKSRRRRPPRLAASFLSALAPDDLHVMIGRRDRESPLAAAHRAFCLP